MRTVRFAGYCCIIFAAASEALAQEVDPEDLKPGLMANFDDGTASVRRLDPTVAVNFAAEEAPHPRLNANGGTYRWKGYLKLLRNGEYTFAANLRGKIEVNVGGVTVLADENSGNVAKLAQGKKVALKAGIQPITVTFQRPKGSARLELLWQIPQYRFEPLPAEQLGHLPKDRDAAFNTDVLADHGRFAFEEHGCIRCHKAGIDDKVGGSIKYRQGPNLTQVGSRVYGSWLESWLLDPRKHRPATTMPRLLAEGEAGKAEAQAISRYLVKLGGPLQPEKKLPNPQALMQSVTKGKNLFATAGCAACHTSEKPAAKEASPTLYGLLALTGARDNYPLGKLGSKTRPDRLAAFLTNPHATNPTTRMPNMTLNGDEARDIAIFLCTERDDVSTELTLQSGNPPKDLIDAVVKQGRDAFDKLPADGQWNDLGRRLVTAKGCANCHDIAPNKQMLPGMDAKPLAKLRENSAAGCLAEKPIANVPHFALSPLNRTAMTAFLKTGLEGSGSKAQAFDARISFKRFGCLNCHQRDGEGGLPTELVEQMQKLEKTENVDDIRPPTLNGVGHKLLTPWFKKVLTGAGRSRPWMSLRMPQYGEDNVGTLAEGIATLEGAELEMQVHRVDVTPTKVEVGKLMIGKSGLGCIGCHDIAGIPNTGTRGNDLASTDQRVRYEWYRRWLEQPQRMAPNTRMPQIFIDGKSIFPSALNGNSDAQAEAMWAYLSLGAKLPLPVGLEPPKGLIIKIGGETEILRTFMPEAGNRAIAVGFPGGVNVAFDANQCRIAYGWAGNFLDASPVWNNRGGAPAKILGPKFWNAPSGNPWSISGSTEPPDFVERAKDPAYGKPLPDLQLFNGTRRVFFDGYTLDETGSPTFKYRVLNESDAALSVSEKVEPVRKSIATGISRNISLVIPPSQTTYMLAGDSSKEPKLFSSQGEEIKLEFKGGIAEVETKDRLVVLPGDGESATVLAVSPTFEGTRWRFQQRQGGWNVLVKIPTVKAETRGDLMINVWSVGKTDAAFLKGLANRER